MHVNRELEPFSCKLSTSDCGTCTFHGCFYCAETNACSSDPTSCQKPPLHHHWQCAHSNYAFLNAIALLTTYVILSCCTIKLIFKFIQLATKRMNNSSAYEYS